MHLFHKWHVIHRYDLPNGRGWFEDRVCVKCGFELMEHHIDFFSTISDVIDLGIQKGIYKALKNWEVGGKG